VKAFRRIAQAFLLLGLILGVWAFWWEPRRLVVREVPLELAGWPREMSGLRVALLTDLHVGGPFNGLPRLREVVRRTNERHPDLILLLGDYMKGHILGQVVTPQEMAPEMGQLEAPLGVFAVLGNHDHWFNGRRVARALQNAGITVLEDQARRVSFRGAGFWIGGISDFWEGRPDFRGTLKQVTDDAPVILMTHNPDLFPKTPARVSLLLAGHTHGGQVRFPFLGALVVPSIYGNRYLAGHVEERGQHLFVATGIGMSYLPVRFGVPPEVTILKIESPQNR
jgi:predicted MPP superfamily phosphohydrolase